MFTTATGGYLNGSTVTRGFQKQLAKAGLRRLKFHHLRHGAASLLLAQRAPMRVVMELLAHSQISLTMNTYAHIAPRLMRDAADSLNAALGGHNPGVGVKVGVRFHSPRKDAEENASVPELRRATKST